MLESESSALPFGDSPSVFCCVLLSLNEGYYNKGQNKMQVLFLKYLFYFETFFKTVFLVHFQTYYKQGVQTYYKPYFQV